mmetsp:Transcript_13717/g.42916  ORF Transcript_13717/g.42916 Transcript_13717/m.42916 type:complete len:270 (+) Transcript_13717:67-876(+)
MLYPAALVSWFIDTLAPPLAASISFTTVPPLPSNQPIHCWSICTCMAPASPSTLLLIGTAWPPTFWRDAVTRIFAASTCGAPPTILTVLQPRVFVDWSMVTLAPLSCSISLARPPPFPSSQPTHFCSTCRSSSTTCGALSPPEPRALSKETSINCLAWARCWSLPCSCATVKPRWRVPWFMQILQPLAVSISRATLPLLPRSQPTNLCSMCNSSYISGPGTGGASMRNGPMAVVGPPSPRPTTARARDEFMCSAACCTKEASPLTFSLL